MHFINEDFFSLLLKVENLSVQLAEDFEVYDKSIFPALKIGEIYGF